MTKEECELIVFCVDSELDQLTNIALQAGKGHCGVVSAFGCVATAFVVGKHTHRVRVLSALRNNGFHPITKGV